MYCCYAMLCSSTPIPLAPAPFSPPLAVQTRPARMFARETVQCRRMAFGQHPELHSANTATWMASSTFRSFAAPQGESRSFAASHGSAVTVAHAAAPLRDGGSCSHQPERAGRAGSGPQGGTEPRASARALAAATPKRPGWRSAAAGPAARQTPHKPPQAHAQQAESSDEGHCTAETPLGPRAEDLTPGAPPHGAALRRGTQQLRAVLV